MKAFNLTNFLYFLLAICVTILAVALCVYNFIGGILLIAGVLCFALSYVNLNTSDATYVFFIAGMIFIILSVCFINSK